VSNDPIQVGAKISEGTTLADQWEEWADDHESKSDAVRAAIREAASDESPAAAASRGLYAGTVVLLVLVLASVRALYDTATMGILLALALGVFAVVYAAPGLWRRVRGGRS